MTKSDGRAEAILELAKRLGALRFGEFRLSAGELTSYYFDGRLLTLNPEGANLVGDAMLPFLAECRADAIAGPTLGADPIVAAVAVLSHQRGAPIPALIVRKEAKSYGMGRSIEGAMPDNGRIAVVDDTCSTGASLFHAIDAVEAAGGRVVKVLSILDRHEGGSEELLRRGYDFTSLLEANERGEIAPTNAPSPVIPSEAEESSNP